MDDGAHRGDDVEDLRRRLRDATSVGAAARATIDHLLSAGYPMPSLYLERGGRLRCVAVHGYHRVYDGMPPDAGVIGRTFRTGEPTEVRGVASSSHYLPASASVLDEVCVPVMAHGAVVGALNTESPSSLPDDAVATLTEVSAAFAARLDELGGPPSETPAQRLTRHAAVMAHQDRPEDVWAAACVAARELSGFSSAALVLYGPGEHPRLVHADGPVTRRLAASLTGDADHPSPLLATLGGWTAHGTSCWATPHGETHGSPETLPLRSAGVGTVFLVALDGEGPPAGFLLVADETCVVPTTDGVELLELLSVHLAACLRTVRARESLEHLATRDSLTGLGHHAAFQSAVTSALGRAAPSTGAGARSAAVLLLDVDEFKGVNDTHGHLAGDALLRDAARVLPAALRAEDRLYRIGGDEFAAVVLVTHAEEAQALGERLHAAAREHLSVTVSIGIATAVPGDSADTLFSRADTALYQVKREGRDGVALAPPPSAETLSTVG